MRSTSFLTLGVVASAALVAACSTVQTPPAELVSARAAVRSVELDPAVSANAPLELKKATDSLNRANTLNAKGESLAEIASASYLAEKQAQTAQAVAHAKVTEDAIRGAQAERETARADAKTAEAQRAQARAAAAQAQASNAQSQAQMARAQASEAEQRAGNAEQRAGNAELQAAAAQANAQQAQQQNAQLQQRLNDLQAKQTERGILVTLGDVLFEFNRADIKPTAQASLRRLADFLQQYPDRRIAIEGYTDNIGSPGYNLTLSQQRAEAVAFALQGMGVSSSRITSKGFGMDRPVAANTTDTNRALNRRVEVYISDANPPLARSGG